mmetsp:Transcript_47613/g.111346  ORF Transcript_47613/g.111346 Transcript_47613/m.111346 type:complete len:89 (+) Transcript_47613:327-593(+)
METPTERGTCDAAVKFIEGVYGITRNRGISVGQSSDCNDRGFGWVPLGCSVQSGFKTGLPDGDWGGHLKTGGTNCPDPTLYQLVCVAK